jgi:hypothetical protein
MQLFCKVSIYEDMKAYWKSVKISARYHWIQLKLFLERLSLYKFWYLAFSGLKFRTTWEPFGKETFTEDNSQSTDIGGW